MSDMIQFLEFRNAVLTSLSAFGVPYKLFGGAVVCLINDNRETVDLDIAIKAEIETVEKFIDALASCGFGDRAFISMQVYGEEVGYDMTSTRHLESTNPAWLNMHIDLCFNIGEHSYDTMPSEEYVDDGLRMEIVSFDYIARMKANIYPRPREKDIEDIQTIAAHLGLDPTTGNPRNAEEIPKKKGRPFFGLFGGGKK